MISKIAPNDLLAFSDGISEEGISFFGATLGSRSSTISSATPSLMAKYENPDDMA